MSVVERVRLWKDAAEAVYITNMRMMWTTGVCADSDECDKYTMFLDCCDYWQGWYYTGK